MQSSMIVIRFEADDSEKVYRVWRDQIRPLFHHAPGLLRQIFGQEVDATTQFAHVLLFESAIQAEGAFRQIPELSELENFMKFGLSNPDMRWVSPQFQHTYDLEKLFFSKVITLSTRTVGLGFGEKAISVLVNAFDEVEAMKGIGGYMIGHSVNLSDEITALALWDSVGQARASIPWGVDYDVRVYEEIR